ncbi:MAG: ATP-binding protein, partial [Bacteriovoracaceae bacterium]|nr:ATP-binding protein [Bacteriovoracaceae bacterium]
FDRFKRLENNKSGGIGLGLSISKEVIEAHKGTIRAYNHDKKGAIFEIQLPLFHDHKVLNA